MNDIQRKYENIKIIKLTDVFNYLFVIVNFYNDNYTQNDKKKILYFLSVRLNWYEQIIQIKM